MIDTSIVVALISAVGLISVAIIEGLNIRRRNTEAVEKQQDRDEQAKSLEMQRAMFGLVGATADGTQVLLLQAHGEKLNGNVTAALKDIECAKQDYNRVRDSIVAERFVS
jgi:hypothetical protein